MSGRLALIAVALLGALVAGCGGSDQAGAPAASLRETALPPEREWPAPVRWVDCGPLGSCALALSVGGAVLDVGCARIRPELVDARVVGRGEGAEVRVVTGADPAAFLAVRPGRAVCEATRADEWLVLLPPVQLLDSAAARAAFCRAAILSSEQRRVEGCSEDGDVTPATEGLALPPLDPAQDAAGCSASGASLPTGARGPVPEVDYAEPPPRTLGDLAAESDIIVLARVEADSTPTDVELVGVQALRGEAGASQRVDWFQPEGLPRPVGGFRYVVFLRRVEGGVAVPALGSLGLYLVDGTCVRRLVPAGPGPDPIALADLERLVGDVPG